jgi:hypothetical protein
MTLRDELLPQKYIEDYQESIELTALSGLAVAAGVKIPKVPV